MWNRTKSRAEALATELNQLRRTFKNPNVNIICVNSVEECVQNADVIVTATFTSTPFLKRSMIKNHVHINGNFWEFSFLFSFDFYLYTLAVGAGQNHHSEIDADIYTDVGTKIYVDHNAGAQSELKTLNAPIVGEVGDIINGHSTSPSSGTTIFHSLGKDQTFFHHFSETIKSFHNSKKGMAVEDVAVGEAILTKFQNKK